MMQYVTCNKSYLFAQIQGKEKFSIVLEMWDTNSFLYETKMQNGVDITKDIVLFYSKFIPTLQLSPLNQFKCNCQ
jgi:hypothetical protein